MSEIEILLNLIYEQEKLIDILETYEPISSDNPGVEPGDVKLYQETWDTITKLEHARKDAKWK